MEDQSDDRRRAVAARVRYRTDRQGMTREVFAGLMGRSVRWADKIRDGSRVLDKLGNLPKERRANHLVDVARAYSLAARTDDAEVRCRPLARDVITDLWRRSRTPSPELRQLAEKIGIAA